MESALIIDAFVLVAALEADLGRHRKIGPWRILRPLFAAAAIIPLFLKAVTTTGAGLYLEIALASAGVALGLAATALMSVYRSPGTGRAVSRSGAGRAVGRASAGYAAVWVLVIGARAAFTYGSYHWFGSWLATWQLQHGVSVAAITDALIFNAVAMIAIRTVALAVRARRVTRQPSPRPAPAAQPPLSRTTHPGHAA